VVEHALEIYWNKKKAPNTLKYITANYSIFDFLLGVGLHFETKRDFHKFSLTDVYSIMTEYVETNHANDPIIKQLIAIDYYLHHKVKPQALFLEEIDRSQKTKLIEEKTIKPS
jgi:anaerobic magnesium-protoporphyrin IX monomethyl ester cyclase